MYYPKKDYNFIQFQPSRVKNKKYEAVLQKKTKNRDGKIVFVRFGAIKENGDPYMQYKDTTGLGLYSKYDHLDKKRRARYIKRHAKDINKAYSPSWFSLRYLW